MTLEPNQLAIDHFKDWVPEIIYEDSDLVAVNKPAGLLSVPGKHAVRNVYDTILAMYPNATGPMLLHRLDMATSGVLIFAKTKFAHQQLQNAFAHGQIQKRYVALLEKCPEETYGEINLPLCLNPLERPRQMVSRAYGKAAVTQYEVLGQEGEYTRVAFYPKTGRTHQLRLHAAHRRGLNSPIVGDDLYGHPADRLYLHAHSLTFTHPKTGRTHQLRLHAAHRRGLNSPIVGDDLYGHPADRLYLHAHSLTFTHPRTKEVITIDAKTPF